MLQAKDLLKGSVVITVGTVIGGIFTYAFSIVMGRALGPTGFGDLGAISSLLLIISSIGTGILTVGMHFAAKLNSTGSFYQLNIFHKRMLGVVIGISVVAIIMCLLFSRKFISVLNIQDINSIYFSYFSIPFIFLTLVNRGVLQGMKQFKSLSTATVFESIMKLTFGLMLVWAGYYVSGAVVSIVLSSLVAYLLTLFQVKKALNRVEVEQQGESVVTGDEVIRYALPVIGSSLILLFIANLDVLLAKNIFDPIIAGQYIAVSTVAKIVFFISSPVSLVMFPMITELGSMGKNYRHILTASTLITIAIGATVLIFYALAGREIVSLLFGGDYVGQTRILVPSTVLMIIISLINLIANYSMSVKSFYFLFILTPFSLIAMYWISVSTGDVIEMVWKLVATTIIMMLASVCFAIVVVKRHSSVAI